jgi:hypothetical protein
MPLSVISVDYCQLMEKCYKLSFKIFSKLVVVGGKKDLKRGPLEGALTFSITTFSITTLTIVAQFATLSINGIQHTSIECRYAEFHVL